VHNRSQCFATEGANSRPESSHLLDELALVAGVHCGVQTEVRDLGVPVIRGPCRVGHAIPSHTGRGTCGWLLE